MLDFSRFAMAWKARRERRTPCAAFELFGVAAAANLARDAGAPSGELHIQAGKWPDATDPLLPRLTISGIATPRLRALSDGDITD